MPEDNVPRTDSMFGVFSQPLETLSKWTYAEAEEATLAWKEAGHTHPTPLSQWVVWNRELPLLQKKHSPKTSTAILEAVDLCGRFRVPLPGWCAAYISEALGRLTRFEAHSWDDACGVSTANHRKLTHLKHEFRERIPTIMLILEALTDDNPPKVTEAIRAAAEQRHVSFELARRWYYEYIKQFPESSTLTEEGWVGHQTNEPPVPGR